MPTSPISTKAAQAMLLAAGRGNRMRPLTDHTPKPLLLVHGRPLLEWHIRALAAQGVRHLLVNTGWLGVQLPEYFGAQYPHSKSSNQSNNAPQITTQISYSREDIDFGGALETAGGIARALPQLADIFWLAAGDVYAPDFAFAHADYERFAASSALAHLWLVPNPEHNPQGDFALALPEQTMQPEASTNPDTNQSADPSANWGTLHNPTAANAHLPRYTYSTIALMRRELFTTPWCTIPAGNPQGVAAPLAPVLRAAIDAGRVTGSIYQGRWTDVGTPQRLEALNKTSLER